MKKLVSLPCMTSVLVALSVLTASCSKTSGDAGAQGASSPAPGAVAAATAATTESKTAVCVYDGLGVRSEIGKNTKFISSLFLGETVKWTGITEKDEAGKDYLKVELSDGKTGWVSANGVQTGAQMGALREDAASYKRPDPLTATNQKITFMTIVAVTQQKDDWLQLVGESKKQLGWVKKDVVALDKEDVTNAILATKKLREKDGLDFAKKVEAIVKASPSPSSYFIQTLRQRATPAAAPATVAAAEVKPEESVPASDSSAKN